MKHAYFHHATCILFTLLCGSGHMPLHGMEHAKRSAEDAAPAKEPGKRHRVAEAGAQDAAAPDKSIAHATISLQTTAGWHPTMAFLAQRLITEQAALAAKPVTQEARAEHFPLAHAVERAQKAGAELETYYEKMKAGELRSDVIFTIKAPHEKPRTVTLPNLGMMTEPHVSLAGLAQALACTHYLQFPYYFSPQLGAKVPVAIPTDPDVLVHLPDLSATELTSERIQARFDYSNDMAEVSDEHHELIVAAHDKSTKDTPAYGSVLKELFSALPGDYMYKPGDTRAPYPSLVPEAFRDDSPALMPQVIVYIPKKNGMLRSYRPVSYKQAREEHQQFREDNPSIFSL